MNSVCVLRTMYHVRAPGSGFCTIVSLVNSVCVMSVCVSHEIFIDPVLAAPKFQSPQKIDTWSDFFALVTAIELSIVLARGNDAIE